MDNKLNVLVIEDDSDLAKLYKSMIHMLSHVRAEIMIK